MSDLTMYTQSRAARDPEFAEGLEAGYEELKIGALLVTPAASHSRTGFAASETPLAPGEAWEGRKENAVDRT